MHLRRIQKITLGVLVFAAVVGGVVIVNNSKRDSGEDHRDALETILRTSDNAQPGDISRNTPHFDGGPVSIAETTFTASTVSRVQAQLQRQLEAKGYTLTCPGGEDTTAPSFHDRTVEPRQKCGLSGHGADGTIWLGTYGDGTRLSALIGF